MLNELYNLFGTNAKIFTFLNYHTNVSILPYFLQIISGLFKIWNFAAIYILVCLYLFFKIKKENYDKNQFDRVFNKMFSIGTIYALFGLAYAAMKFGINMPRPYCSIGENNFTTIANLTDVRCHSSFPSAHTALAILVTYFIWPYIGSTSRLMMIALAIMVAISRITLAMHYPSDIIYSGMITIMIIYLGNLLCHILDRPVIANIRKYIFNLITRA